MYFVKEGKGQQNRAFIITELKGDQTMEKVEVLRYGHDDARPAKEGFA
jgi:hypothetical protein